MSDEKIMLRLSVQGSHFVLPVGDVTRHDWLVRTMLETDLPTDRVADALYLNCDAESFRLIYMLLCGTASMPQALERLSDLSLSIVRAAAEYLLCFEVVRAIDDMVAKKMDHQVIVLDETKQRESELRHQLDEWKAKASSRVVMENVLSSRVNIQQYSCGAFRMNRSYNICGDKAVIVGDCSVSPICDNCNEPMKTVKKKAVRNIADLEDLFTSSD